MLKTEINASFGPKGIAFGSPAGVKAFHRDSEADFDDSIERTSGYKLKKSFHCTSLNPE